MHYTVEPGLYALGEPNENSPVLVTANYKMSFDCLRSALPDRNAWVLVLDTRGINVWCAAGKGTFGTDELAERVQSSGLHKVVAHRRLVLPQLAAPGVSAHRVRKRIGFEIIYGPVLAADLPAFLDAGFKASGEMRRKRFTLVDRMVLIPIELTAAVKIALMILPAFLLLSGLLRSGPFWSNVYHSGLFAALALMVCIFAGAILAPLMLPWIPGRAFSIKGFLTGLLCMVATAALYGVDTGSAAHLIESVSWFLMVPAAASFLTMNFTGASTYTSLSGVRLEMRYALPLQIAAVAAGLVLWLASGFFS